jgi:hypothetical protein
MCSPRSTPGSGVKRRGIRHYRPCPGRELEGAASQVDVNGLVLSTNNSRASCYRVPSCWRPFLWSYESGYRELGTPNDSTSVVSALGMNAGPTVVGWAGPTRWDSALCLAGERRVYDPAEHCRRLRDGDQHEGPPLALSGTRAERLSGDRMAPIRRGDPLSPDDPHPRSRSHSLTWVWWWARSAQAGGGNHATLWMLRPAAPCWFNAPPKSGPPRLGP